MIRRFVFLLVLLGVPPAISCAQQKSGDGDVIIKDGELVDADTGRVLMNQILPRTEEKPGV